MAQINRRGSESGEEREKTKVKNENRKRPLSETKESGRT